MIRTIRIVITAGLLAVPLIGVSSEEARVQIHSGKVWVNPEQLRQLLDDNSRLRTDVVQLKDQLLRLRAQQTEMQNNLEEAAKVLDKCVLVTRFLSDELDKKKRQFCS